MSTHLWQSRTHMGRRPAFSQFLGRLASLDGGYRQRRSLERLDDHLLRDIGLTRDQVTGEFRRQGRG